METDETTMPSVLTLRTHNVRRRVCVFPHCGPQACGRFCPGVPLCVLVILSDIQVVL